MCMYAPKTHEVDADYWIDNRVYSGTVTQVNSESHLFHTTYKRVVVVLDYNYLSSPASCMCIIYFIGDGRIRKTKGRMSSSTPYREPNYLYTIYLILLKYSYSVPLIFLFSIIN